MIFPAIRRRSQLMPAAAAAPAPVYCLEVAIRIQPGRFTDFQKQAELVLPEASGNGTGLTLVAAGYRTDPDPRTLLHFWKLDSADMLRSAMVALSDIPAYSVLDDMVVQENQHICTPLVPVAPARKRKGKFYVRITGRVPAADLAEFVAQLESQSALFAQRSKWLLVAALVNVTGRVNGVSLIWKVASPQVAEQFATQTPGYAMIQESASEIWTPTTYDPDQL